MAGPSVLYDEGTHAARPANGSGCVLYYCSDHDLIYRDDGSTWTTWVDVSGSGTVDHNHTTTAGDGGDLDGARVGDFLEFIEAAAPSTPATGFARVYAKSDGRIYSMDDAGVEYGPFDASGGGGGSGYPVIIGTPATTTIGANGTSHVVNLPSGIVSGELLLIFGGIDGTATASATGWTAIPTVAAQSTGNCSIIGLYRIADGSEGATVTVTSSASEKAVYWATRIDDWHGTTPPEGAGAQSGSASTSHDPPSLTPSWGSAADLWFAIAVSDLSADAAIVYERMPIPYSYITQLSGAATDSVAMVIAQRDFTGTVQDPAPFNNTVSEQWCAGTVAVRPV